MHCRSYLEKNDIHYRYISEHRSLRSVTDANQIHCQVGDSLLAIASILALLFIIEARNDLACCLGDQAASFRPLAEEHGHCTLVGLKVSLIARDVVLYTSKPQAPLWLLASLNGALHTCSFPDIHVFLGFTIWLEDLHLVVLFVDEVPSPSCWGSGIEVSIFELSHASCIAKACINKPFLNCGIPAFFAHIWMLRNLGGCFQQLC